MGCEAARATLPTGPFPAAAASSSRVARTLGLREAVVVLAHALDDLHVAEAGVGHFGKRDNLPQHNAKGPDVAVS